MQKLVKSNKGIRELNWESFNNLNHLNIRLLQLKHYGSTNSDDTQHWRRVSICIAE